MRRPGEREAERDQRCPYCFFSCRVQILLRCRNSPVFASAFWATFLSEPALFLAAAFFWLAFFSGAAFFFSPSSAACSTCAAASSTASDRLELVFIRSPLSIGL